jgi:hypothetical protein
MEIFEDKLITGSWDYTAVVWMINDLCAESKPLHVLKVCASFLDVRAHA